MMDIPGALPYVKSGKLKALAVLSSERHPLLPDVPTVAEQGWPGFEFSGWNGIALHRDTPPQVVAQVNTLIRELVAEPEFNAWLRGTTVAPDGRMGVPEVGDRVRADAERLGALVRELGITVD
jgi:tripartite-type tricarboxylate transporter receptor subunit TctC